jgi:hypothetical protein
MEVKMTLEIPDVIYRRAKSASVQRGIPLRAFVTEALMEKLEVGLKNEDKPWVRLAGGLKHLHKETKRINRIIYSEFENIDPKDWK